MSEYKLFAQRVGLVGIVNLLVSLRGLILLPILTKTLDIELYGIWVQIIVTISLLTFLATLQLHGAIIRFFAGEQDKAKIKAGFYSVFALVFLFSLLLIVIIAVFSEPFAITFFGGEEAIPFVRLLYFLIPATALDTICIEFFRAFQQMKKYTGFLILQQILELSLISYAVLFGYSLFGALLSLIIARIFLLIVCFLFIYRQIGIEKPDLSVLKPYLLFSLPLIPAALSCWVVEISDRYLIAYFLGVTSVAIYSPAYILGTMIGMFMSPLGITLLPTMFKLYENNKIEELKKHLSYSLKVYLMFAIPSLFGLTVLSKSLLLTFTTSEFVSAYLVVPMAALGTIFYVGGGTIAIILQVLKKTRILAVVGGAAAVINLILNIILIPIVGILGAAISTLITFLFMGTALGILSFKGIPFEIDFKFIAKCVIASIPMAFGVWKLQPYGVVNISIAIVIAAAIYFAVLTLLRGFTKEEYLFLKGFLVFNQ